jgi:hypothetical protein
VPINKGYLTKITAERARRERPDFIAPGTTNEVQKSLVGKPLEKVVRSAPVILGEVQAPQSTKVIKLDGGRISLITVQMNFVKARVSSLLILKYSYLYLPPHHHPLLPPPLQTKLFVPDHSLNLAGREWSGTEIVILSKRLQY